MSFYFHNDLLPSIMGITACKAYKPMCEHSCSLLRPDFYLQYKMENCARIIHVLIIESKRTYRAGVEMSQDVAFPLSFCNVDPTSSQVAYTSKVNVADTFVTTVLVRYAVHKKREKVGVVFIN